MKLIRELFDLLFDFRNDAKETADSLKENNSRNDGQSDQIARLTDLLEACGLDRKKLREKNEELRQEIESLRNNTR